MILAQDKIIELVNESKLIEKFSVDCLCGAGYDLRLGKAYKLKSPGFVGRDSKKNPDISDVDFDMKLTVKPGEYMLIESVEPVNIPGNIIARILPRSSIFRMGGYVFTAVVDPGYQGRLTMGFKNLSDFDIEIERYARVAQIVFEVVEGSAVSYSGQYQGGKIV